jgi:membrane protease YdiL (CAAX protease family)
VTPRIGFPSILLLFFGGLLAALIAYFACVGFEVPRFAGQLISAMVNDGYWLAGYEFLAHERGWPNLRARFAPVPVKALLLGAGAAIALVALFASVFGILHWLGVELRPIPPADLLEGGPKSLPFIFILIVILAPAAEELLCRGLLLDWLRQRMPVAPSIIIAGLIFGLMHGISVHSGTSGWLQFGYRTGLGVISGIFAVRYRSLLPSFVLHAVNNCVVVIVASQLK